MRNEFKRLTIFAGDVLVDENQIGYVFENVDQLWSARDTSGRNHGDWYLDQWCAAKQLQLALAVGV